MVCIVTAFYNIPSKQRFEWYIPHIKRWFRAIQGTVVFFTTQEVLTELRNYDVPFSSSVQIVLLSLEEFVAYKRFGYDFWKRQCERDCEKYHTPELAMVWYEKRHFVLRAMELLPEENLFIWCDAGCVRSIESEEAARHFGRRTNIDFDDDKIHLQQLEDIAIKQFYTFPDKCIAGAIMAGNRNAWKMFDYEYDTTLIEYDTNCVSGNMDQYIILNTVIRIPQWFILHMTDTKVDKWFKFLELL